ncbi:MAG: hypothetical protein KDF64_02885, partial [Geminicoccaceae bacterium]|nr:hypothetical protein [Geminicoccaceae bacterium]
MSVQVSYGKDENLDDVAGLVNGATIGTMSDTLTSLIDQNGGAPVPVKLVIGTPGYVVDYAIAVSGSEQSGWQAQIDALAKVAVGVTVGAAVAGVTAAALGVAIATAPVAAVVGISVGTAVWMYTNSDLVESFAVSWPRKIG